MAILTVCGSGKNRELIHAICAELGNRGHVVLTPPLHNISKYTNNENMDAEGEFLLWKGATFAHLNRIKTSEVCIMINPKGYLGCGSTLELGFAAAHGKFIIALQHDEELARESLFDVILESEDLDIVVDKIENILRKIQK